MRSRATSPPQVVAVLAALCVGLSLSGAPESPRARCDNGKLSLDRDLPAGAVYWDCAAPTWPGSTQTLPSMDSVHDPEPAREICMDKPISYNHSIPSSGPFRPVKAESGEYLYCPPQRWLNNLHHGAVVLLHHPCAPLRERHLLSGLARSCLPGYVITSHPQLSRHMPVALVSWGRALQLATAASSEICDWLQTTQTTRRELDADPQTMRYNFLLIRPAGLDQLERTPDQESMRRCCEETISSLNSEPHVKRKHLMRIKKGIKDREKRDAGEETEEKTSRRHNISNVLDNVTNQMNRTTSQNHTSASEVDSEPSFPKQAPQSETQKQNPNKTLWMSNSDSNVPKSTFSTDSVELLASKSETNRGTVATEAPRASHQTADVRQWVRTGVFADGGNSKQNRSVGPEGSNSAGQDVDSAKHKRKDEEREVEHVTAHTGQNAEFNSNSESQLDSGPQQKAQAAERSHATSKDCHSCNKGSGAEPHGAAGNGRLPRTPRSDEAVWAAAALGFLLVLLTLSILHTRLYRYWRTTPSLYWHNPQQDYDSVADIIRRRLRIAKRRKKRGRRQECLLLPSSSSSDEHR